MKSKAVLIVKAEIKDNKLWITVREGERFDRVARHGGKKGFPFRTVLAGTHEGDNKDYKDTDSLQVAVRWGNATMEDVGHNTNAEPADRPRKIGAKWEFKGTAAEKNESATWSTEVPVGATKLNVILVYTDTLMNPPTGHGADLPIIAASFEGKKGQAWTLKKQPNDVVVKPRRFGAPSTTDVRDYLIKVAGKLDERTGYKIRSRPAGLYLPPKFNLFNTDTKFPWWKRNRRIINSAAGKTINLRWYVDEKTKKKTLYILDTGYDIIRRK